MDPPIKCCCSTIKPNWTSVLVRLPHLTEFQNIHENLWSPLIWTHPWVGRVLESPSSVSVRWNFELTVMNTVLWSSQSRGLDCCLSVAILNKLETVDFVGSGIEYLHGDWAVEIKFGNSSKLPITCRKLQFLKGYWRILSSRPHKNWPCVNYAKRLSLLKRHKQQLEQQT